MLELEPPELELTDGFFGFFGLGLGLLGACGAEQRPLVEVEVEVVVCDPSLPHDDDPSLPHDVVAVFAA